MDQFKQTYFEECEDRIQDAEEGLSMMLDGDLDKDTVNRVFRAIHSIKGGAGAFAFNQIVDFAHEFETVLDFVREGKLTPDRDMCTLFLRSNDVVAEMLSLEQSKKTIPESIGANLLEELRTITSSMKGESAPAPSSEASNNDHPTSENFTWSIVFRPHEDMLKTGNEPYFILQALKELGDLKVTTETDNLPSLHDIHAEHCFIGWRLTLKTSAPEEEIREAFDFVEDLCDLEIAKQNVPPGDLPERRKAENRRDSDTPQARRKEDRDAQENAPKASKSIRVDLDRIDQLVNLVGEMVIAQSMLQEQVRWLPPEVGGKIGEGVEHLTRHMRDLQESVMAVRAQPIKSVFTRMPRIIREVCAAVGKDVRLTTFGEDTEVDKTVLENLIDPLTHMIRNSVDHGVETPSERQAAGKEPYGTIELSARHRSGRIIIEITDDGKGINRSAVLKKAQEKNLIPPDHQLTDSEIDNLIFKPGFSTADKVSEVSGRGVGMDVVRKNVISLGGRINVASTPGKGCVMTLSLPLTLAVMDGMVVSVGSQRFVLPTINIIESFRPPHSAVSKLSNGVNVIIARGDYVRLVPLYNIFGIQDAVLNPEEGLVILLESDNGEKLAVMVDDVLGQQQVVIKSLETNYTNVKGISAATILGNGDVALILDVPGLSSMNASIDIIEEYQNALKAVGQIKITPTKKGGKTDEESAQEEDNKEDESAEANETNAIEDNEDHPPKDEDAEEGKLTHE